MKIAICGSGTAGHFYPSLELGESLERKGHSVFYVVNKGKIEEKELKQLGKNIIEIDCRKVDFKTIFYLKDELKSLKIDAAIGFGGYASFNMVLGAFLIRIPTFIHEQNIVMGNANRLSQLFAKQVFVSFEKTEKASLKAMCVGNPIIHKVKKIIPSTEIYDVIFVMGSLGSTSVNRILFKYLKIKQVKYKVLVITGKEDFPRFKNAFLNRKDVCICEFDNSLISHIKSSKLVVCRSGATTLCELEGCSKPAVLIPSPYVKNNHQLKNALAYSKWGAAKIIEEKDLTVDKLKNTIDYLLENNTQLQRMSNACNYHSKIDSIDKIIEVIESYG